MENKPERTKEYLLEHLNQIRSKFAFHLREDHGGKVVPPTCHTCLTIKQRLIFAEEDFEKYIKV